MHKHEAVKQFDKMWEDAASTLATAAMFVVQKTDGARKVAKQLKSNTHATHSNNSLSGTITTTMTIRTYQSSTVPCQPLTAP